VRGQISLRMGKADWKVEDMVQRPEKKRREAPAGFQTEENSLRRGLRSERL